jgi:hypothetical protein
MNESVVLSIFTPIRMCISCNQRLEGTTNFVQIYYIYLFSKSRQMKIVTDGVEIIIATPGRLNDLVEAGCIQIESVTYLVLDEVLNNLFLSCQIWLKETIRVQF